MNIIYILLIVVAGIIGLVALLLIIGRISANKKGVVNLKKRVAKIQSQPNNEIKEAPKDVKVDFNRPEKTKGAIVTSYQDMDDDDKRNLGIQSTNSPSQELVEKRRKSFEEIMRKREQARAAQIDDEDFSDDDFDDFRQQHSSYISYQKDEQLISEIRNMSPQARKILFSSLFDRIDKD